eukprot:GDKJ01063976.1.p1 GENE.GDKJ01063976.1~~GDKJ01063976.1.p1  ORF type:complete len:2456 (-),score=432.39 GDKJ01063976.1:57-6560(-)
MEQSAEDQMLFNMMISTGNMTDQTTCMTANNPQHQQQKQKIKMPSTKVEKILSVLKKAERRLDSMARVLLSKSTMLNTNLSNQMGNMNVSSTVVPTAFVQQQAYNKFQNVTHGLNNSAVMQSSKLSFQNGMSNGLNSHISSPSSPVEILSSSLPSVSLTQQETFVIVALLKESAVAVKRARGGLSRLDTLLDVNLQDLLVNNPLPNSENGEGVGSVSQNSRNSVLNNNILISYFNNINNNNNPVNLNYNSTNMNTLNQKNGSNFNIIVSSPPNANSIVSSPLPAKTIPQTFLSSSFSSNSHASPPPSSALISPPMSPPLSQQFLSPPRVARKGAIMSHLTEATKSFIASNFTRLLVEQPIEDRIIEETVPAPPPSSGKPPSQSSSATLQSPNENNHPAAILNNALESPPAVTTGFIQVSQQESKLLVNGDLQNEDDDEFMAKFILSDYNYEEESGKESQTQNTIFYSGTNNQSNAGHTPTAMTRQRRLLTNHNMRVISKDEEQQEEDPTNLSRDHSPAPPSHSVTFRLPPPATPTKNDQSKLNNIDPSMTEKKNSSSPLPPFSETPRSVMRVPHRSMTIPSSNGSQTVTSASQSPSNDKLISSSKRNLIAKRRRETLDLARIFFFQMRGTSDVFPPPLTTHGSSIKYKSRKSTDSLFFENKRNTDVVVEIISSCSTGLRPLSCPSFDWATFYSRVGADWSLSLFEVSKHTGCSPLLAVGSALFSERIAGVNLATAFLKLNSQSITPSSTISSTPPTNVSMKSSNIPLAFLSTIEREYLPNSYHNKQHGAEVGHCTITLMRYLGVWDVMSVCDRISIIIASLCHDIGHPGVNNGFMVSTEDSLAITYNDTAVLESFHAATTFRVMQRPGCKILKNVTDRAITKLIRKNIIELILETDMSRHFEALSKFKIRSSALSILPPNTLQLLSSLISQAGSHCNGNQIRATVNSSAAGGSGGNGSSSATQNGSSSQSPFDPLTSRDDGWLIARIAIKAADIGHSAKPWAQHYVYSLCVSEEFYMQGDMEKRLGLPVSPLCERTKTSELAKSQIGFLGFVCRDLFSEMAILEGRLAVKHKVVQISGCLARVHEIEWALKSIITASKIGSRYLSFDSRDVKSRISNHSAIVLSRLTRTTSNTESGVCKLCDGVCSVASQVHPQPLSATIPSVRLPSLATKAAGTKSAQLEIDFECVLQASFRNILRHLCISNAHPHSETSLEGILNILLGVIIPSLQSILRENISLSSALVNSFRSMRKLQERTFCSSKSNSIEQGESIDDGVIIDFVSLSLSVVAFKNLCKMFNVQHPHYNNQQSQQQHNAGGVNHSSASINYSIDSFIFNFIQNSPLVLLLTNPSTQMSSCSSSLLSSSKQKQTLLVAGTGGSSQMHHHHHHPNPVSSLFGRIFNNNHSNLVSNSNHPGGFQPSTSFPPVPLTNLESIPHSIEQNDIDVFLRDLFSLIDSACPLHQTLMAVLSSSLCRSEHVIKPAPTSGLSPLLSSQNPPLIPDPKNDKGTNELDVLESISRLTKKIDILDGEEDERKKRSKMKSSKSVGHKNQSQQPTVISQRSLISGDPSDSGVFKTTKRSSWEVVSDLRQSSSTLFDPLILQSAYDAEIWTSGRCKVAIQVLHPASLNSKTSLQFEDSCSIVSGIKLALGDDVVNELRKKTKQKVTENEKSRFASDALPVKEIYEEHSLPNAIAAEVESNRDGQDCDSIFTSTRCGHWLPPLYSSQYLPNPDPQTEQTVLRQHLLLPDPTEMHCTVPPAYATLRPNFSFALNNTLSDSSPSALSMLNHPPGNSHFTVYTPQRTTEAAMQDQHFSSSEWAINSVTQQHHFTQLVLSSIDEDHNIITQSAVLDALTIIDVHLPQEILIHLSSQRPENKKLQLSVASINNHHSITCSTFQSDPVRLHSILNSPRALLAQFLPFLSNGLHHALLALMALPRSVIVPPIHTPRRPIPSVCVPLEWASDNRLCSQPLVKFKCLDELDRNRSCWEILARTQLNSVSSSENSFSQSSALLKERMESLKGVLTSSSEDSGNIYDIISDSLAIQRTNSLANGDRIDLIVDLHINNDHLLLHPSASHHEGGRKVTLVSSTSAIHGKRPTTRHSTKPLNTLSVSLAPHINSSSDEEDGENEENDTQTPSQDGIVAKSSSSLKNKKCLSQNYLANVFELMKSS